VLRVALKEYQSRIEGLLEGNRLPEAAAHCHFLLQQYPRHIGTYRLFGRALLDQQLFDDAIDVFHRVVSADPEDLIAHAGLALAHREKQDLTIAIWHMERAFEIEPYNGAIQEELRDLSSSDGGIVRRGFGLNKAALARLYFRGGLYPMAATELTSLLEKSPDRFDLQVLLAETYYWEDRRLDAVNQCLHIMEQLPYCIKAHAILADLWLRGGRFCDAK
jgi:tetratricopeptide (TPR) repeat protein